MYINIMFYFYVIIRVQVIKANVLDGESLKQHLQGVDVVFATFAVIKYWQNLAHNYKLSHDVCKRWERGSAR
jgi:putative NADH-flavin reductase